MDFRRPVEAVVPGAQGRILAVLAKTSAELSLRTIARLSGVSVAQVSRILPSLVELGLLERREAPPSVLFHFVPENVAARAVTALAESRETVLREIGAAAAELDPPPMSVIVFGSFARGDADRLSDLDVVFVRGRTIAEDDPDWRNVVDAWREHARRLTGNPVELLEVSDEEASRRLRGGTPFWLDVQRDGVVVYGASIEDLKGRRSA